MVFKRWKNTWIRSMFLFTCHFCVIGMRVLFSCEAPRDEFLRNLWARFPGRFLISGPLNRKLQGSVSFLLMFQQAFHEPSFAVEVLAARYAGVENYLCVSGSSTGEFADVRWSTVTRSTKGLLWMTAVSADKSRTLSGPSVTPGSLEFSSQVCLETASDGSRKI